MTKQEIIQILRDCLVVETIGQYSFKIALDKTAEAIFNKLNQRAHKTTDSIVEYLENNTWELEFNYGYGDDAFREYCLSQIIDGEDNEKS